MSSSLPTTQDVAMSAAAKKFHGAEEALKLQPEHISRWVETQARHSGAVGLAYAHGASFITLGAGRQVWALYPERYTAGNDVVEDIVVINHPSLNGMDPHHFYKGLVTSLVTDKPVFMIPASTRRAPWRFPAWSPAYGDYLSHAGGVLCQRIQAATHSHKGIKFSRGLRLHLQGWSQGGTLSLAMAAAVPSMSNEFEVGSVIVGGLPNVKERSRRELFRDTSSISLLDYIRAGRLSGSTYSALHCPNGVPGFIGNAKNSAAMVANFLATWGDNFPLHEAFRHGTLTDQLDGLSAGALKKTIIVSASDDPVSPAGWVHRHLKDAEVRPSLLKVNGTHTFGDVIAWPFFAADKVGITI